MKPDAHRRWQHLTGTVSTLGEQRGHVIAPSVPPTAPGPMPQSS